MAEIFKVIGVYGHDNDKTVEGRQRTVAGPACRRGLLLELDLIDQEIEHAFHKGCIDLLADTASLALK